MALCVAAVVLLLTASTVHGGVAPPGKEGTIVGGRNATVEEFPWQVALEHRGGFFCAGSVLSERWVLTAAHCSETSDEIVVRSSTSTSERGGLTHRVTRRIKHERYEPGPSLDYDIAVLQVEEPFVWSKQLQPVRGLATEDPPVGSRVVVTGWGSLFKKPTVLSDQLQQVAMSIVDWKQCREAYEVADLQEVTERKICSVEPDKGDCDGDSGGPVIDEKSRVQVGIVSSGADCANVSFPNVHTSVAKLRGWIREKTGV